MKGQDDFLIASTARLVKLIEDQERLLEIVRNEKAELIGMNPTLPLSLPLPN
jgi:hypothetical protein